MKTTVLRNSFHGTEIETRMDLEKIKKDLYTATGRQRASAERKAKKLRNQLCLGGEECTCGGDFGERE